MVDVPLSQIRIEIRAFDEAEEELVDDLEMRPGELENRLVLFRIKCVTRRIDGRGYRAEEVGGKLVI